MQLAPKSPCKAALQIELWPLDRLVFYARNPLTGLDPGEINGLLAIPGAERANAPHSCRITNRCPAATSVRTCRPPPGQSTSMRVAFSSWPNPNVRPRSLADR